MKSLGILALTLALMLFGSCVLAQAPMRLHVQRDALDAGQALRLLRLLQAEYGDDSWMLMEDARPLRDLVLAGDAPDLAICSPGEARRFAQEGLLLALQDQVEHQAQMQRQVLEGCVCGENLFMAPLMARHRQMAVNVRLFEEAGLGYMLDREMYPVWFPAQFYQIMEEFMLRDTVTLDIWRPEADSSAAVEALTQAIFGGELITQDGEGFAVNTRDMQAGVLWLSDAVDARMIGWCESREEALARFLGGETAIFIDWTPAQAQQSGGDVQEMEILAVPYPGESGVPVRSFELTGVCAFAGGDAAREEKLRSAAALLYDQAKTMLGAQGIWQDCAVWLWDPLACDGGATLRSLYSEALCRVLEQDADAQEELDRVQAAMETLGQTQMDSTIKKVQKNR